MTCRRQRQPSPSRNWASGKTGSNNLCHNFIAVPSTLHIYWSRYTLGQAAAVPTCSQSHLKHSHVSVNLSMTVAIACCCPSPSFGKKHQGQLRHRLADWSHFSPHHFHHLSGWAESCPEAARGVAMEAAHLRLSCWRPCRGYVGMENRWRTKWRTRWTWSGYYIIVIVSNVLRSLSFARTQWTHIWEHVESWKCMKIYENARHSRHLSTPSQNCIQNGCGINVALLVRVYRDIPVAGCLVHWTRCHKCLKHLPDNWGRYLLWKNMM